MATTFYDTLEDLADARGLALEKFKADNVVGTAYDDERSMRDAFFKTITHTLDGMTDADKARYQAAFNEYAVINSEKDPLNADYVWNNIKDPDSAITKARDEFSKTNMLREIGKTYYGTAKERNDAGDAYLKQWDIDNVLRPREEEAKPDSTEIKAKGDLLGVDPKGKLKEDTVAGGLTDQQKLAFAELQRLQGGSPVGVSASVSASGGGGARISQYSGKATWNANGGRSQFDARITRGGGGGVDVSASAGAGGRPFVGSGFAGAGGADGANGMVPPSERARLRRIEALQRSLGIPTDEELRKEEMQKRINFAKASAAKTAAGDERRAQEAAARREDRFRKSVEAVGGAGSYDKLQELHKWQQENKANWGDMTQEALGMTKARFNALPLEDKIKAGGMMKSYFDGLEKDFSDNVFKMEDDAKELVRDRGKFSPPESDDEAVAQLDSVRRLVRKSYGQKARDRLRDQTGLASWSPNQTAGR